VAGGECNEWAKKKSGDSHNRKMFRIPPRKLYFKAVPNLQEEEKKEYGKNPIHKEGVEILRERSSQINKKKS
jgi:hypothetical protein